MSRLRWLGYCKAKLRAAERGLLTRTKSQKEVSCILIFVVAIRKSARNSVGASARRSFKDGWIESAQDRGRRRSCDEEGTEWKSSVH
jgi:hypothetical protein